MTVENKFRPKDLVEVYTDKEELALRGGGLYALVCARSTDEENADNQLLEGRRSDWVFYKCILEDEIHFVAEQYMTLAQRHELNPDGTTTVTGTMADSPEAAEKIKQSGTFAKVDEEEAVST